MLQRCRTATALIVLSLALLLTAACVGQAQELLQNGSFEGAWINTANGVVADHWEQCYRPGLGDASYQNASYTGLGFYQKIFPGTTVGHEAGICQRVTGLTPGAIVRFGVTVYQKASNCTAWMAVDPNNSLAAGALPSRTSQIPYASGQWTYKEITATVGAGGAVAVYVWVHHASSDTRHININDATLIYVDPTIHNLAVASTLSDSAKLTWSAPAAAAKYEIRRSTAPITSANWSSATVVTAQVPPLPGSSGAAQSTWVRGLTAGTTYYYAMKSQDSSGTWSAISNCPSATTTAAGSAPYWAWRQQQVLSGWYQEVLSDCQEADANSGAGGDPNNQFSWYFGGWDSDCEHNPPICQLLQIVRDPWILGFMDRLCDHVWNLGVSNTCIDRTIFNNTGVKVPTWNESHHGGERSWNGVTMTAVDYDNPKWLPRLLEYAGVVHNWVGYTGDASTGGPHLHFKTFWVKADAWDYSGLRGLASLTDNPEDRRFTRALWYAAWRDPSAAMPDGQPIKDFLYELDTAQAEDAMKTDWGKPIGVLPAEVTWYGHQIGGYSHSWWQMSGSMGGTVGTSGEWWWDWRYGFVQSRDAYYELVDQYRASGDPKFIDPVRGTIQYFSVDAAVNDIPPQYMGDPPTFPWPDRNDPWGGYQYIVNYLYRESTGDTQFDQHWLNHANKLVQTMPPPGAPRYTYMWRSSLTWDTSTAPVDITPQNTFFMAWAITKDKEWLCKAMDEMTPSDQFQVTWTGAMYNGTPNAGINRLPDQPITWNMTNTNLAALVLDWDYSHVHWLTCNFDPARTVQIWLWSLRPGDYVLRHGPDANGDDAMDSVTESIPFTYTTRRMAMNLTLASNCVEVWEIVPVEKTILQAKALADQSPVALSGCVVTAAFDGFFYVENSARTMGIKVESLADVSVGDMVTLNGLMSTTSGEKCAKCITVPVLSHGNTVPRPLAMNNKSLGGGPQGAQAGVWDGLASARGTSNIGLLVKTSGKVVDKAAGCIYIDDGSECYSEGDRKAVKVITAEDPDVGSVVAVEGVSACEVPAGESEPIRVVRAIQGGVQVVMVVPM